MVSCRATLLFLVAILSVGRGSAQPQRRAAPTSAGSIRVGLVRSVGAAATLSIGVGDAARLVVPGAPPVDLPAGALSLSYNAGTVGARDARGSELASGTTVRIEPVRAEATLSVSRPGQRARRYRGVLEARVSGKALRLIDELPMEGYLRGVVPLEMAPSAPAEALKAQAIAARSYAVRSLGRYRAQGYDVSDTTDCQAYGGVDAERASTDAAVRDTRGALLVRGGEVVLTDYYDDCGGVTSGGESDDDYPPSVIDGPPGGADYCAGGSHHTWTLRLAKEELARLLRGLLPARLGVLQRLEVSERDTSGRARRVLLVGEAGQVEVKGYQLRGALGYERLRSTLCQVEQATDGTWTFTGKGWGHGHGLCQTGAMGMAAPPYRKTCAEILQHFFPGSDVRSGQEVP